MGLVPGIYSRGFENKPVLRKHHCGDENVNKMLSFSAQNMSPQYVYHVRMMFNTIST